MPGGQEAEWPHQTELSGERRWASRCEHVDGGGGQGRAGGGDVAVSPQRGRPVLAPDFLCANVETESQACGLDVPWCIRGPGCCLAGCSVCVIWLPAPSCLRGD